MAKTQIELTTWCMIREEWSRDVALRRLSCWEAIERVDDDRVVEIVWEDEPLSGGGGVTRSLFLIGIGKTCIADVGFSSADEKVDPAHPFARDGAMTCQCE